MPSPDQQPSVRAKMIALFAVFLVGVGVISFIAAVSFWNAASDLKLDTNEQVYIASGLCFLASAVSFGAGLLGLSVMHRT